MAAFGKNNGFTMKVVARTRNFNIYLLTMFDYINNFRYPERMNDIKSFLL
jgi:hypothetical protein